MTRAIERTVEFDAPPARVWRAITDPFEIASWFGDSAELDLRPGGSGRFGWEKHGNFAVRVEVVDPPVKLAWRWAKDCDVDVDEGVSTSVEWVLKERADGGTVLELTESGFETDDHLEENSGGWKAELAELVQFVS
jgi:uncharacterized protein YndB with AHSA1/START domain